MTNEQLAEHVGILVQSLRAEMTTRFEQIDTSLNELKGSVGRLEAAFERQEKQ